MAVRVPTSTKVINEETISEVSKRLENLSFFSLSSVPDDSKDLLISSSANLHSYPNYSHLKPNTIRVKKTRLRNISAF